MKKMITMLLATVVISQVAVAQNLDKMSEKERNKKLLILAKQAILKHGPDWYREYKEPSIEHVNVNPNLRCFSVKEQEKFPGRSCYIVTYFYDTAKERMRMTFAVKVYIWGDTGLTNKMGFGNGSIMGPLDTPETRGNGKPKVMPFKKHDPPKPIYKDSMIYLPM